MDKIALNVAPVLIRHCFCLLFSLAYISLNGQVEISGRVLDANTSKPIANAAVYFNHTSIAAMSDAEGQYSLTVTAALNTELVISSPGYELMVYKPELDQQKKYTFKLKSKTKEGRRLIPVAAVRKQWLEKMQENLLGISLEADKCTLYNLNEVYFTGVEGGTTICLVDSPLVVINKMLGYKIIVDVAEFWFNEASGESDLTAFMRYEELEISNERKYKTNRSNCYKGSSMHFYRSLVANQLQQEGFTVFFFKDRKPDLKTTTANDSILVALGMPEFFPASAQELLFIDSTNNFSIRSEGKILVQYNKNPGSKIHLQLRRFNDGMLDKGIECFLEFATPATGISSAGFLRDLSAVQYNGYWLSERIGNTLPYDYKTEN